MTKAIFIINPLGTSPSIMELDIDPNLKQLDKLEIEGITYEVRKVIPEIPNFDLEGVNKLKKGVTTYHLMPNY